METVNCPCRYCKIYLHSVGFYRKRDFKCKKEKNSANIKILRSVLLQLPVFYSSCGPIRNQTSAFCITNQ